MLESVYEICFEQELIENHFCVQRKLSIPVFYKGKNLGTNLFLDLLVNDLIIVELKAEETVIPVYQAQLLSYLKLTGKPKGLLINFHCENIKEHLVPLVTSEFAKLSDF